MFVRTSRNPVLSILILSLVTALAWPATFASAGTPSASGGSKAQYSADRFLVKFKPGTPGARIASINRSEGVVQRANIHQIGVRVLNVPKGKTVEDMVARYAKNPNVSFAEPDYVASATTVPDDPYFTRQSGARQINAPAAWDKTTGDSGVTIAILDTGLDMTHPDIADRWIPGADFVEGDGDPADDGGHGTRVTGIAAATGNNQTGVAGVDWQARIMPVKVLDNEGNGTWSTAAQGITFAADNGARVLNMSFSGTSDSETLHSAVQYAFAKGCVIVATSGNDGIELTKYPCSYPEVLAVGSANASEGVSSFSTYGSHLDVVAPGEGIDTTAINGRYGLFTGTSAAAPFVSGVAALMLAVRPDAAPADVMAAIRASARDLGEPGWDKFYGWGHLDAAAAVAAIAETTPTVPSEDPVPVPEPTPTPVPAPGDSTAPSVSITRPTDGESVSGSVSIDVSASDDTGIARVEFYADDVLIGASTAAPYSVRWNARKLTGGHVLYALAYDEAGNCGRSADAFVTVSRVARSKPSRSK